MGKSTISMAFFNSFLYVYQRVNECKRSSFCFFSFALSYLGQCKMKPEELEMDCCQSTQAQVTLVCAGHHSHTCDDPVKNFIELRNHVRGSNQPRKQSEGICDIMYIYIYSIYVYTRFTSMCRVV